MPTRLPPTDRVAKRFGLKQTDQAPIAAFVVLALVGMAVWWAANGGPAGRLINIERAGPVPYAYRVDANSAEWPELAQLPGVGPILAKRIVQSRQTVGPYRTPDDLLRINGIGERILDRFRGYLLPLPGEPVVADR